MKSTRLITLLFVSAIFIGNKVSAQSEFVLFSNMSATTTYLIDTSGNVYNQWNCNREPALTAYLLGDGSIMRPYKVSNPTMIGGGVGGGIQIIDWNGNVTWDYTWASTNHQQHHDVIPLDKGGGNYNALLIAWERKSNAEAIQAGRQNITGEMWPEEIIEIEPVGATGGNVVWEWHAWDHLCQDVNATKDNYYTSCDDHPELFDINLGNIMGFGGDWIHANGMDHSPGLDQIVFSSHSLDEIYVIDHSTTTSEAASNSGGNGGIGGDLLYRWGNPENYGAGTSNDRVLYVCHCANFIDPGMPGAGNIMVFNNGDRSGNQNDYSSVEEIIPPLNGYNYTLPWDQVPTWSYSDPQNFYSNHLSGAFRLNNGNTLATEGTSAHIIEVTPSGQIVFDYSVSGSSPQLAKAVAYPVGYSGIIGIDNIQEKNSAFRIYPNPFKTNATITIDNPAGTSYSVSMYDVTGKVVKKIENTKGNTITIQRGSLIAGLYIIEVLCDQNIMRQKVILE